jgi:hypothetical protein
VDMPIDLNDVMDLDPTIEKRALWTSLTNN